MTSIQQGLHTQELVRPISFIAFGPQQAVPVPLIRVNTCGLLTLESVAEVVSTDPPLARYVSLTPEQLRGRGTAPALTLLKLLLNRYEHFASKDWLLEQFCRDGELFTSARIENIVSLLRGLLCPPDYQELRTHLVAHVRGSMSSGDGYQLALYPLIWVDSEALAWNVEQAARMERFGDDGLPFWERAYSLAKRGPYLPDEMFSEWATFRREEVRGMLRQTVQALARLYVARHGGAGEEEALLLLRSFWQEHLHEEDILRALMELLGQRERYHEALEYYERFQKLLAQDDQKPTAQTQDVATYLRTKQIQRVSQYHHLSTPTLSHAFVKAPLQEIEEKVEVRPLELSAEKYLPNLSIQEWHNHMSISPHMELFQQFSSILKFSSSLDKTLLEMWEQQTHLLWQHRETLNIPLDTFYQQVIDHLIQLKMSLEDVLLPTERIKLCDLASRTLLLAGVVLYDMGLYPHARRAMQIAAQASLESGNVVMHGLIYAWMSFTWTYAGSFSLALPCILKAQSLVEQGTDRHAKAWIAAIQAEIYAHLYRQDDCMQALQLAERSMTLPSDETYYLFGLNQVLLDGYKGVCLQQFYQRHNPETHIYLSEAKEALERALQSNTPARRKRYYLGDLSIIEARRGEIEAACLYATQSLMIPSSIESKSMWQRIVDLRTFLRPYQQETSVQTLETHIRTQMLGQKMKEHI